VDHYIFIGVVCGTGVCFVTSCLELTATVLVSWPDGDPSLGSKLVAIQIELFTSELVMTVNIYRY